ncbi:histidine kinase A domain-containing protein [Fictibacillus macauensis ZFHKF-1]|uniref:histidine kinase n=1 Tax=Fictibacillus macauensis ZFHKF-1 TaxID=1196324 RepID=I8UHH0_9BACL|nr:HAMP domain-containing sensor histidine kinase [Fictibacillus macauensis]EIT86355.1 histidine kinase A domain-containing protein [Fictibacillus macauensis ZFHKF-1]
MAIKWKSKIGIIIWLLLFIIGIGGVLSAFFTPIKYTQSYWDTEEFRYEYNDFVNKLNIALIDLPKAETLKKQITISGSDINNYRTAKGSLTEQIRDLKETYAEKIEEAKDIKETSLVTSYKKERDQKIEKLKKFFRDDNYVKKRIKEKEERKIDLLIQKIQELKREFAKRQQSFLYYVKNKENGKEYTNIPGASSENAGKDLKEENTVFLKSFVDNDLDFGDQTSDYDLKLELSEYSNTVNTNVNSRQFEGKIGILSTFKNSEDIYNAYKYYNYQRLLCILLLVAGIIASVLTIWIGKKKELFNEIGKWRARKVYQVFPLDLRIILLGITSIFGLVVFNDLAQFWRNWDFIRLIPDIVYLTCYIIQIIWLFHRAGLKETLKEDWQRSLTYRFWKAMPQNFKHFGLFTRFHLLFIVIFLAGFGVPIAVQTSGTAIIYLFLFVVVVIPSYFYFSYRLAKFNNIIKTTKELAEGKTVEDLPFKGKSPLANLARNINTLKQGVKTLQTSEAKSERLKTELISNVSHDLRTPLTSIITYSELLKTPHLDEETRNAYIEIVDRKSKRLKILIDDLFEASKMASGNIELHRSKVDLVQLFQQAMAEQDERIQSSTLQFRTSISERPMHAVVDGPKIWRVFDNLLGNILNYSLEHTRVYISLHIENNQAVISFKNVSKFELGSNVDELFERFKRGDASRHTEGSGLGLAISKSIIDLHGGTMDIDNEGDLFKAIIKIDLA